MGADVVLKRNAVQLPEQLIEALLVRLGRRLRRGDGLTIPVCGIRGGDLVPGTDLALLILAGLILTGYDLVDHIGRQEPFGKPLVGERVHGGLNIGLTERFDRRDIREDHKAVKTLQCQDDRQQHGGHTQTTVRFFRLFPAFLRLLGRIRFILPIAGIGLVAFDGAFLLLDIFPTF